MLLCVVFLHRLKSAVAVPTAHQHGEADWSQAHCSCLHQPVLSILLLSLPSSFSFSAPTSPALLLCPLLLLHLPLLLHLLFSFAPFFLMFLSFFTCSSSLPSCCSLQRCSWRCNARQPIKRTHVHYFLDVLCLSTRHPVIVSQTL